MHACSIVSDSLWLHRLYPPGFSVHGFFHQEYWSGLPFPPPGVFPSQGLNLLSSALAGIFITTEPGSFPLPGKPRGLWYLKVIMLVVLERIRRISQNWLRRRCQQGIWTKWNRNNDQMINMDLGWFISTQGQPKELGHCPSVCYVQLLGEFWLAWIVAC